MRHLWKISVVALCLVSGLCVAVQAQDSRGPRRDRDRSDYRDRDRSSGRDRDGQRSSDRRRDGERSFSDRGGPASWMYGRYLNQIEESYQLNDAQRQQVRQRLEQIREADRPAAEQRWREMGNIRDQYRQLREKREAGEQISPESYRQLEERMRTLFRNSPLMNRDNMMSEVEKLLPPDQAARGREQLTRRFAEEDRRREEIRRQWEQWRDQGGDPGEFWRQQRDNWLQRQGESGNQNREGDSDPGREGDSGRSRDRGRGRDRLRDQRAADGQNAAEQDGQTDQSWNDQSGERRRGEWRRDSRREDQNRRYEPNLGPWEQYVRDFSRRYQLDSSQQSVAQTILRDYLQQRKAYEELKRSDFAAARQIQDMALQREQLAFLNRPVDRLFEQLKTKLELIPTAAQRQLVAPRPSQEPAAAAAAASQPAAMQPASTQPASTRPSQRWSRRDRDSDRSRDSSGERRRPNRGS